MSKFGGGRLPRAAQVMALHGQEKNEVDALMALEGEKTVVLMAFPSLISMFLEIYGDS